MYIMNFTSPIRTFSELSTGDVFQNSTDGIFMKTKTAFIEDEKVNAVYLKTGELVFFCDQQVVYHYYDAELNPIGLEY